MPKGLSAVFASLPYDDLQILIDTKSLKGAGVMVKAAGESRVSDMESADAAGSDPRSKFYPVMGANISVQAIVEGSLLAEIELDPVPEYGIHF